MISRHVCFNFRLAHFLSQENLKAYKTIKYVPFNPNDKFTCATIVEEATGKTFRVMKGSPQVGLSTGWE